MAIVHELRRDLGVRRSGTTTRLILRGALDGTHAPSLSLDVSGIRHLVVDLRRVVSTDALGASALSELERSAHHAGTQITVLHGPGSARPLLG